MKTQVVKIGKIDIYDTVYTLFFHEDSSTIPSPTGDAIGLCDYTTGEIHASAQGMLGNDKVCVPDGRKTKQIGMHEIGHALGVESSAISVLHGVFPDEAFAEFSVQCMQFGERHGMHIEDACDTYLKEGSDKQTKQAKMGFAVK